MSILTAATPLVQTAPAAPFTRLPVDPPAAAYPADDAPADEPEPIGPGNEDEDWYLSVIDHADWPRAGELSPTEEEIELATLDRYNDALSAMFEEARDAARYEAGIPCW